MSRFRFINLENFKYLTGFGRSFALDVDRVLQALDQQSEGAISDFISALRRSNATNERQSCRLDLGCFRFQWDQESGEFGYNFDPFEGSPELDAALAAGVGRYGGEGQYPGHAMMLIRKSGDHRLMVTAPFGPLTAGFRDISGMHQVYCHEFLHGEDGGSLDGLRYIGVTKRGWQTRWSEHLSASDRGSRYRFHEAIRQWRGRCLTVSHNIIACGQTEKQAMDLEEKMVGFESLYPRGLNMIPGGYAGIAYLRKIGAAGEREHVSPDAKHEIINRFFETTSRRGQPNPLAAANWTNSEYAEKVICGPDDRLKPDQIRTARFLSSLGKAPEEIASEIGARNLPQVQRLLRGDTYSRVA